MKDLFYIVKIKDEEWYRLHIKDTHYCIGGCSSLDSLLRTIKRLIKRYRTKTKILSALSHQEDKGVVNEKTMKKYKEDYELYSEDYDDIVYEVVSEALKEVKEDTPFKRIRKRLGERVVKNTETTGNTSGSSPSEEVAAVKKTPMLLGKRPKLLRRT